MQHLHHVPILILMHTLRLSKLHTMLSDYSRMKWTWGQEASLPLRQYAKTDCSKEAKVVVSTRIRRWLKMSLTVLGGLGLLLGEAQLAWAQDPNVQELMIRLDRLEKDNAALKGKLEKMEKMESPSLLEEGPEDDQKKVQKIIADYMKAAESSKNSAEEAAKKKIEEEGYKVGSALNMTTRWDGYGLRFETPYKDFSAHIGGRMNYDSVWWSVDQQLQQPGQIGPYNDGSFFRRIRLLSDGTFWEVCEWNMELILEQTVNNNTGSANAAAVGSSFNPTPNGMINLDEVWVGVKDVPLLGTIRVGHQKTFQGLETISSSRAIPFMERSAVFDTFWCEFADAVLVTNTLFDERATWAAEFGRADDKVNDNTGALFGDGQYFYVGRVTGLPIYENEGRCLLHLGASFGFYNNNAPFQRNNNVGQFTFANTSNQFRYRTRPDLRDAAGGAFGGNNNRWIDTGAFIADHAEQLGTEFLYINGPFWVEAEYAYVTVDNPLFGLANGTGTPIAANFRPDLHFQGYYVSVGYFLTGENKTYDRRLGRRGTRVLTRPNTPFYLVRGENGVDWGWGAWEVLAGFDYIDLNSGDLDSTNFGNMTQERLGLNWYLNPNFKIQFNYVNVQRNEIKTNASTGTLSGNGSAFGTAAIFEF